VSPSPREQLLNAALARASQGGIADLSLRQIAGELGTSHRMVIYHFGSKEGLLAAVSSAVEQQQRDTLAALGSDPSLTPVEAAMRMWERFADPALWPLERLFFDLYAQALQGKEHLAGFLDSALEPWFAPTIEAQAARGMPRDEARALARLGVAVTRGLLLDLLATGDRAGVDAAMRMFLDWYQRCVEGRGDEESADA
jgi:AcrR family transcriptional regulator